MLKLLGILNNYQSLFSEELFKENIYAIAFSYPVVPKVFQLFQYRVKPEYEFN
jgi:hypothetical protein